VTAPDEFAAARAAMLHLQIAARGILDSRVLRAMGNVPRHEFVAPHLKAHAYDDGPLPIGQGQTISQPYIVARMTELLEVAEHHRVLEIGSGCGYQTAVLCRLAGHVYAIERLEELAARARENLKRAGIENFSLACADGTRGWPQHAPFDRVLVAAAAPAFPAALAEQLAVGGRMVAPLGPRHVQQLTLGVKRADGGLDTSTHGAVVFVPLIEPGSRPA